MHYSGTNKAATDYILLFLFNSDITVSFADQKIKAHKFVLAARGDHWSSRDLNEISELQLIGLFMNSKDNLRLFT